MKELIELQHAIQAVSKIEDIKLRTRKKEWVLARALFCTIAHQDFKFSKSDIGRYLDLNHATVIHLIKKANDTYKTGYDVFNFWHVKLEQYYKDVYLKRLSDNSLTNKLDRVKQEIDLNTKLTKQNEELRQLLEDTRERLGDLKDFLFIPEYKMQNFKDTRLTPYLKMLKINTNAA